MAYERVDADHADPQQKLLLNADRLGAAVLSIARQTGAEIRERPIWPGAESTMRYAEPVEGLRIASGLEEAAAYVVRDYIRYARRDGRSWLEIGIVLEMRLDPARR